MHRSPLALARQRGLGACTLVCEKVVAPGGGEFWNLKLETRVIERVLRAIRARVPWKQRLGMLVQVETANP